MKQQNDTPITMSLLQTKYEGATKDTMVKTNFQEVVANLEQIISKCSTHNKPALIAESLALDCKGIDPYDCVTVRIRIVPGDKVDLFLRENATKVSLGVNKRYDDKV